MRVHQRLAKIQVIRDAARAVIEFEEEDSAVHNAVDLPTLGHGAG